MFGTETDGIGLPGRNSGVGTGNPGGIRTGTGGPRAGRGRARPRRMAVGCERCNTANTCKDWTATGPLGLRQTRREASDPGTYNLTVQACINVAIGTRQACHELTSDGSPTPTWLCTR